MTPRLPAAVPEIPVSNIDSAVQYYRDRLGFNLDWLDEDSGLAGISSDHCRLFLAGPAFRAECGNSSPVSTWLNLQSASDVDDLHRAWRATNAILLGEPELKSWGLHEFTAADPDGNRFRVFYDVASAAAAITTFHPTDAPEAFQRAWNAHDMSALAALFHEDATFVNRFGHYVRGVDEIVALHRPIHDTIYRDSTLENELIDAIPVGDGATVVHFWSRLRIGPAHPGGAHDVDTLIMAVVTLRNGAWRIQALENVTLTNPRTGEIILRR